MCCQSSRVYECIVYGRKWILRWRGDLVWLSLTAFYWLCMFLSHSLPFSLFLFHSLTLFLRLHILDNIICVLLVGGLETGRNFPLTVKIFKWKERKKKKSKRFLIEFQSVRSMLEKLKEEKKNLLANKSHFNLFVQ